MKVYDTFPKMWAIWARKLLPQAIKVAQSAINAQSGHTSCSSNSAAAAADDIKAHSFKLHRESAN